MKTFKIIDLGIQVLIVITALVMGIVYPYYYGILVFFLGLLVWNIISQLINLFLPIAKSFTKKRIWLYIHTVVIVLIPFIEARPDWYQTTIPAYIIYALGLAIYYMILCYRELRYLSDLRDQIRLSDIQHH